MKSIKILVVEDEALIAHDIVQQLHNIGHEVVGPTGRAEMALDLMRNNKVELGLLDVHIIGGTSYPVALELHNRGTPFVFVTGYGMLLDMPPQLANTPRLMKPFTEQTLRLCISTLMEQRHTLKKDSMVEVGSSP